MKHFWQHQPYLSYSGVKVTVRHWHSRHPRGQHLKWCNIWEDLNRLNICGYFWIENSIEGLTSLKLSTKLQWLHIPAYRLSAEIGLWSPKLPHTLIYTAVVPNTYSFLRCISLLGRSQKNTNGGKADKFQRLASLLTTAVTKATAMNAPNTLLSVFLTDLLARETSFTLPSDLTRWGNWCSHISVTGNCWPPSGQVYGDKTIRSKYRYLYLEVASTESIDTYSYLYFDIEI